MHVPNYSKKAQLQIIETILVLFIFLIILIFGIYFYYQYSFSSIQEQSFKISELESSILLSSITSLPELSCETQKNCIDIIKLVNFQKLFNQNKPHYLNLFKNKKITIRQIYPEIQDNTCIFTNTFPIPCREITIYQTQPKQNNYIVSIPISLYYPHVNKYSLGKLIIEVYP